MSLFYGYSKPEVSLTSEQFGSRLKEAYKVIFDLNVTRASKNALSKLPPFIDYIEDRDGIRTNSVMFWRPSSVNPQINTAGDHHFLYPETTIRTTIHANVSILMFVDVSVFVAVKRNSVRPVLNVWETIISNDSTGKGKNIGFKAGVNDKLVFSGITPTRSRECTIPAKFIGKKILISIHWLSRLVVSHIQINGEILKDSYFMCDIEQIGTPYLDVFGVNSVKIFYSDINFYGMRIVEGRLGDAEIEKICKETMAEYGL